VLGAVIGTLRTLQGRRVVVGLGNAWVELFRNIPLLVQIFLWYHVLPSFFPVLQGVPGFVLVVFALGFFTSARIAEQVRSGIQALPRGQRYAGLAMGFTTFQTYRYVLLPMAFRIIIPPLTSETMNIFKNSSVAFAVSVAELTMFAMQAQEETSRGIEVYLAVTALYVISAFAINRIMAFIEKRARVPGMVAAGSGGGTDMNLDFSFYNWDLISNFVLKGLYFSLMLTVVATIGGVLFGTVLALMRLSGKKWLDVPATIYVNGMRSIPLVMVILWFFLLVPAIIGRPIGAEVSAVITFIAFEAAYFSEIMRAGIQSIPRGQVYAGQALGMTYGQNMKLVVLPQAFRNMLPVLLTQTIILFQDTSLVYAIGAYDMLKGFEVAGKNFGRPIEAYLAAAVLYFVMCYALSWAVKRLHQKIAIIR
jgi:glutamate/aspartate transport system permease protein